MGNADQHHFRGSAAIRTFKLQFANALQQHLPGAAQHRHGKPLRQSRTTHTLGFRQGTILAQRGGRAKAREQMAKLGQILQNHQGISAQFMSAIHDAKRCGNITAHQRFHQINDHGAVRQAQHVAHGFRAHLGSTGLTNRLIQQGKPIAHGTIGSARNHGQCIGFRRHSLLLANPREMLRQAILRHAAQREGLAAAADRDRHLAQLCCCQNESHA